MLDLVVRLHLGCYFSTLDLASGYWQIPMEKDSKEKTAFITDSGLYQFNVMSFGLTNAPATFQRYMDAVLAGLKWNSILVYLDDIIIFSPSFEQHVLDLRAVFVRLQNANLRLKASKCMFCKNQIKYLGHIISADGIQMDPAKIKEPSTYLQF